MVCMPIDEALEQVSVEPILTVVRGYARTDFYAIAESIALIRELEQFEREMIAMLLQSSYFLYAIHDDEAAFGSEQMAKEAYQAYQKEYTDEERIELPDFKMFRYFALIDFLSDEQYPATMRRNLMGRINVERPELAEQLQKQHEKLLKELEKSK